MNSASRFLQATVVLIFGVSSQLHAQQQQPLPSYPTPRLTSVMPAGAKVGTTVEVTLNGVDLDGAEDLYFSHARLKARRLADPMVDPKKPAVPFPVKFEVQAPADTPLGSYDIRVVGKSGMSNPRTFVIGDLNEIIEKEPNNDVADAQPAAIGSVVNGLISTNLDVDYYSFAGKKGQRIVVYCATSAIDSKSQPQVSVHGPRSREIATGKKPLDSDVVLDCVLPLDGDYLVRVCEFTYLNGGPDFFYRLSITEGPWIDAVYPPVVQANAATKVALYGKNLPGGQPDLQTALRGRALEKTVIEVTPSRNALNLHDRMLTRLASVDGFSYRLPGGASNAAFLMLASDPVVLDNEDNDSREKAQLVPLPAMVCGKIERRGDRDFYLFEAKQGETLCIEAYADRLQSPLDLSFQLRKIDGNQFIGLFDDNPEIPIAIERFYTATDDPKTKFVVPADGQYELLVRSLMGDLQGGPNHIYCLHLRKPRPDFRLVLVSNYDNGAGLTLRQGSSQDIQVICFRQDDFKGEVFLTAEGLPNGVTCVPQVVGPQLQQAALAITAAPDAPDWIGELKIKGTAVIDGVKVVRDAHGGCLVYPTAAANIAAVSRLTRSNSLAVRSKGPFRLETTDMELSAPIGGQVKTKVKVTRLFNDYKDNVEVTCVGAPARANGKPVAITKVTIAPDKDGEIKFQLPNNTPAGIYNLVFRGTGKLTVDINKKKVQVQYAAAAPPIQLHVFDTVAELALAPQLAIKPGTELAFPVKVNRLKNYKGELKVELVIPNGVNGVSAVSATIPPGANETNLLIKATKDAKPTVNPNFLVRATAKFDNIILKDEKKLQVAIATNAVATTAGPITEFRTVKLLEEGASGWKYLAATAVKGDGWRNLDFDDSKWKSVKAPFGNGEPEVQRRGGTQVPEIGGNLLCRRIIDIPAEMLKSKGIFVRLQVASDNSAVVYLNGQMVDEEKTDHEFSYWNRDVAIEANLLRPGRNIVAVQLLNSNGSSDAYLDVAITAQTPVTAVKSK